MTDKSRRVLVTGGGTFLGDNIAAALLAEGAQVTLLVRPGNENKLGPLAQRVRWFTADVWNPASLRGRARGHASVIHTVGSMVADPSQGSNHHWLNFVSARNVTNMCVGDGVPHMMLLSSVRAPWVNGNYLRAKREAEEYMFRVGLQATIIRAPIVYIRGERRHPFYMLMTLFGSTPILSWFWFGRAAPMPIDMLARGVARITLDKNRTKQIYYAPDLRKRNTAREARRATPVLPQENPPSPRQVHPFELLDEDTPFAWTPPERRDEN
ncbi:MAG: SDR family oxidoreductase [Anaerolineae bacterium]